MPVDHLVVGAGTTGLAVAWRLAARGDRVLVLEARATAAEAPGAPVAVQGDAPHLEALLAALPGAPRLVPEGGLAWRPRGGRAARRSCDLPPPGRIGRPAPAAPGRAVTLAEAARRRLGARALRERVGPWARFAHGLPAEGLGAVEAWPALAVGPERGLAAWRAARRAVGGLGRVRVLEGGAGALATALADALGDRLSLGREAVALAWDEAGACWRVRTADGAAVRGARVWLALPPAEQARLLEPHHPLVADALRALERAPRVTVAVAARPGAIPSGPFAGWLPAPGAPTPFAGALALSRLDPTRVLEDGSDLLEVRCAPWSTVPTLPDLPDAAWDAAALHGLAACGARRGGLRVLGRRRGEGDVVPRPGHRRRIAEAASALAARGLRLLGEQVTGPALDARVRPAVPVAGTLPDGAALLV